MTHESDSRKHSLPDELRDPACDVDSFKQFFKTILFSSYYSVTSALEVISNVMRSINPRFTYFYLLTYTSYLTFAFTLDLYLLK